MHRRTVMWNLQSGVFECQIFVKNGYTCCEVVAMYVDGKKHDIWPAEKEEFARRFERRYDEDRMFRAQVDGQSLRLGHLHQLENSITGQREIRPVKDWVRD